MTGIIISTGAPSTKQLNWSDLEWSNLQKNVFRLQVRIAKVEREGKRGKVKALQRLLTCSFSAKALAVKRVTVTLGVKLQVLTMLSGIQTTRKHEQSSNLSVEVISQNP